MNIQHNIKYLFTIMVMLLMTGAYVNMAFAGDFFSKKSDNKEQSHISKESDDNGTILHLVARGL